MGVVDPGGGGTASESREARRLPIWSSVRWGDYLLQWCELELVDDTGVVSTPDLREIFGQRISDGSIAGSLQVDQSAPTKPAIGGLLSYYSSDRTWRVGTGIALPYDGGEPAEFVDQILVGNRIIAQTRRGGLVAVDIGELGGNLTLNQAWKNEYQMPDEGSGGSDSWLWPLTAASGKILCAFERVRYSTYHAHVWEDEYGNPKNFTGIEAATPHTLDYRGWAEGHAVETGLCLVDVATGDVSVERVFPPATSWTTQLTGYSTGLVNSGYIDRETEIDVALPEGGLLIKQYSDRNPNYSPSGVKDEWSPLDPDFESPLAAIPPEPSYTSAHLDADPVRTDGYCEALTEPESDNQCCSYTRALFAWYLTRESTVDVTCSLPWDSALVAPSISGGLAIFGPRQDFTQPDVGAHSASGAVWTAIDLSDLSTVWTHEVIDDGYRYSQPCLIAGTILVGILTNIVASAFSTSLRMIEISDGSLLDETGLTTDFGSEMEPICSELGVLFSNNGQLALA